MAGYPRGMSPGCQSGTGSKEKQLRVPGVRRPKYDIYLKTLLKVLVGFIRVIMQQWVQKEFRYLVKGGLAECKTAKKGERKRERKERRSEKEECKCP